MTNNKYDINSEEFIAKWISGDLSEAEAKAFEAHPDYASYLKIKELSNQLSFSDFDQQQAFDNVLEKTRSRVIQLDKTPKKNIWKYAMTVAAAIVLLFGLTKFFTPTNTIHQGVAGEQLALKLPDHSEVLLNGDSRVSFSKKYWKANDRIVDLTGEAYFKVTKGQKFTVNTTLGKVQVLGTQFTVNTLGDTFIVKCFEGRVGVTSEGVYKEITKGMAVQVRNAAVDAWEFDALVPSWLDEGVSNFRKIEVSELIEAFKRQYEVEIEGIEHIDNKEIFTGSFPNKNLQEAVKVIFKTLDVRYKLEGNSKIIIFKE